MHEKQCWDIVLNEFGQQLSKANFQTWFSKTELFKIEDSEAHVAVPNDFVKDWLETKYKIKTLDIIRIHFPSIKSIKYVVKEIRKEEENLKKPALYERISQSLPLEVREDGLNPKYTFDSFIIGSFNELAYAASQYVLKNPGTAYNPLFIYGNTGLGKTHLIQAPQKHQTEPYP
jgi:chromosomal replication initiator protein